MPTYEFRLPDGTIIEKVFRISEVPDEIPNPNGEGTAVRIISGGAALVFKGSGFYLTDYGRNAHRTQGDAAKQSSGSESSSDGASGKAESGDSKSSDAKPSDSKSADPKASDSKASDSKASDSKSTASKPAESKSSDAKPSSSSGDSKSSGSGPVAP